MAKGYEDLGIVIDESAVVNGESAVSEWFDGMTWASGLLVSTSTEGLFSLSVESRDSHGNESTLSTGNGVSQGVGWASMPISAPQGLGFGFRIKVLNEGETSAAIRIAVQVVG